MATATAKDSGLSVTLGLVRETKNTYRFDHADGNDSLLPSLYVKKSAWDGKKVPESITVTVS